LDDELIGSLFPVHRQAVLREASALSRIWAHVCVGWRRTVSQRVVG